MHSPPPSHRAHSHTQTDPPQPTSWSLYATSARPSARGSYFRPVVPNPTPARRAAWNGPEVDWTDGRGTDGGRAGGHRTSFIGARHERTPPPTPQRAPQTTAHVPCTRRRQTITDGNVPTFDRPRIHPSLYTVEDRREGGGSTDQPARFIITNVPSSTIRYSLKSSTVSTKQNSTGHCSICTFTE